MTCYQKKVHDHGPSTVHWSPSSSSSEPPTHPTSWSHRRYLECSEGRCLPSPDHCPDPGHNHHTVNTYMHTYIHTTQNTSILAGNQFLDTEKVHKRYKRSSFSSSSCSYQIFNSLRLCQYATSDGEQLDLRCSPHTNH